MGLCFQNWQEMALSSDWFKFPSFLITALGIQVSVIISCCCCVRLCVHIHPRWQPIESRCETPDKTQTASAATLIPAMMMAGRVRPPVSRPLPSGCRTEPLPSTCPPLPPIRISIAIRLIICFFIGFYPSDCAPCVEHRRRIPPELLLIKGCYRLSFAMKWIAISHAIFGG